MERLVVGRVNSHHRYLFALSPQDLSEFPQGNLNLFFLRKRTILDVRTCGGLLCFNSYVDGRVVICNPTTRQLKFLPPIPIPRPRPRSRGPVQLLFKVCGFGYDSTSDDYKVIRAYDVIYHDDDIFRAKTFSKMQLYSLRRNSWSEIPFPRIKYELVLPPMSGTAFVKGSVYLVAYSDTKKVLAFDFATETFSYFSLPPPLDEDTCFHAVNIDDDSLGVVLYTRDKVSKSFEVWVWREENKSWSRLYDRFVVDDVERPVGLKDGRLLFLERERNPYIANINDPPPPPPRPRYCPPRKQLVVYDLVEKRLKEFDIYDYHFGMVTVNSYVESRVELPDSMPIGYYDDEASWNQYWNRWEAKVNNVNNRRRYGGGERRRSEREGRRRCFRRERGRERVGYKL